MRVPPWAMKVALLKHYRGVGESGRPHLAHNQEIAGSNPAPAIWSSVLFGDN